MFDDYLLTGSNLFLQIRFAGSVRSVSRGTLAKRYYSVLGHSERT